MATVKGNSSANTLNGTSSADYIYGYGGNDMLNGNGGDDHLYGGDGADKLNGGYGNDYLYGNAGNDLVYGNAGNDYLYGNDGNDTLHGGDGADRLDGGSGVDWLYGDGGNDIINFGGYADHYDGGSGTDTLSFANKTYGWTYTDSSVPNAGGSVTGFEKIVGSSYGDFLYSEHIHNVYGGGGNDSISGYSVHGDAGNDDLTGDHDMWGGSGADTFHLYFNGQDIQLNDAGTGFDPGYNNIGATIHDYVLGTDHISWEEGNQATNGVTGLTHDGDVWTIHYLGPGEEPEASSFTIVGSANYDHLG